MKIGAAHHDGKMSCTAYGAPAIRFRNAATQPIAARPIEARERVS
jgi:hypothetical protein